MFTCFSPFYSFNRQDKTPHGFSVVLNFRRRRENGERELYTRQRIDFPYILKRGTPAPKLCCARVASHFNWIAPVYISGAATYDRLKSRNVAIPKFPENYASPGENKGVPPLSRSFLPSSPRPVAEVQTYDRAVFALSAKSAAKRNSTFHIWRSE